MSTPFTKTLRSRGLTAGTVGLLACVAGLVVSPEGFYRGYLVAYLFWIGLSLGCLSLLMLHHLVAGGWGIIGQRHFEAGALTIGLMAALFVPLLFGMHHLYEWTHAEAVAESAGLQHKEPYLNEPFFIVRAVIYFAFWFGTAYCFRRWSLRLGETGNAALAQRMRRLAAGGLIAHILLLTFASVDWVMSLEPEWFSSIFGWLLAVSEVLTALALSVIVLASWAERERDGPLARAFRTKYLHDYGNLILAFVVLWMYMMFAQYIIMWSGNLPEEVAWYVHRREAPWGWIAPTLVALHFAVPFAVLLSRRIKRSRWALRTLAAGLLVMHLLYLAWLVWPSFEAVSLHVLWIAVAALVGIGGLWCAAYAWLLGRSPPLPRRDPRFEDFYQRAGLPREGFEHNGTTTEAPSSSQTA